MRGMLDSIVDCVWLEGDGGPSRVDIRMKDAILDAARRDSYEEACMLAAEGFDPWNFDDVAYLRRLAFALLVIADHEEAKGWKGQDV